MTNLAALPTGAARRVVYLGTPEVAVVPLRRLVTEGVDVALVVTRVDKRRGRGPGTTPSPVKAAAIELGLPVSHRLEDACTVGADLGVVVAYGRIIPTTVLERLAMINVHFSLLPRWRGAAPVERAILAGDTETGVCIMRVEEGLDTGVVFSRRVVPIRPDHTVSSLRDDLVRASLEPLLDAVTTGCGKGVPQEGDPTYAAKIDPTELRVRWSASARHVAALSRLEGAWFEYSGRRIGLMEAQSDGQSTSTAAPGTILSVDRDGVRVACGDGVATLVTVQPAGKKPMSAVSWANGARLAGSRGDASLA